MVAASFRLVLLALHFLNPFLKRIWFILLRCMKSRHSRRHSCGYALFLIVVKTHREDLAKPVRIPPGWLKSLAVFLFVYILTFIHFWERKTETERRRGRGKEREGDTESEAGSRLSCQHRAWRRAWTHKPRDHDLSRSWTLNRLSHPGAPTKTSLIGEWTICGTYKQWNTIQQ